MLGKCSLHIAQESKGFAWKGREWKAAKDDLPKSKDEWGINHRPSELGLWQVVLGYVLLSSCRVKPPWRRCCISMDHFLKKNRHCVRTLLVRNASFPWSHFRKRNRYCVFRCKSWARTNTALLPTCYGKSGFWHLPVETSWGRRGCLGVSIGWSQKIFLL